MARIAIVGGGYSGAISAYWLLQSMPAGTRISIFEPGEDLGRGAAYADGPDHVLLNVPANYLSPMPGDLEHFFRWVMRNKAQAAQTFREADGAYFVPRAWFGTYMRDLLREAVATRLGAVDLVHIRRPVTALRTGSPGVTLACGALELVFDAVVLAIGTAPPRPLSTAGSLPVIQSAWQLAAQPRLPRDAHIVIVGAGLTMADTVAELWHRDHRGPIATVSRHGLMPHRAAGLLADYAAPEEPIARTARAQMQQVRRWAKVAANGASRDWRPVVDHIRRNAPTFWRAMPAHEQARFRRHVRSYWEIHRYPMPPATHRIVRSLLENGRLVHVKARALEVAGAGLRVSHHGCTWIIPADVVINASGPDPSFATSPAGGLPSLLQSLGLDAAAASRRGIDISDNGEVLALPAELATRVWCLGYLARGRHGELGTVNAIGEVAQRMARALIALPAFTRPSRGF